MELATIYDLIGKPIEELAYSGQPIRGWGDPQKMLRLLVLRYGSYVNIELGPGKNKQRPAGIGLNSASDPTADILWDLNQGIPLPNKSVNELYSNQFLEHLLKHNQIFFWNEMWRVLKPGGTMQHTVPHYLSPDADGDPTHFTPYSEHSFQYYCVDKSGHPFVESFSDYGIVARFEMTEIHTRRGIDIMVRMRKPE